MNPGFEAGIHDGQILIGQGDIDDDLGLEAFQQRHEFWHMIGIDSCCLNWTLQFRGDAVTLRFRAAGQHDFTENIGQLGAFMSDDAADAACSDDEYFVGHGGERIERKDS